MKKYFKYILILIAIVSVFSFGNYAEASLSANSTNQINLCIGGANIDISTIPDENKTKVLSCLWNLKTSLPQTECQIPTSDETGIITYQTDQACAKEISDTIDYRRVQILTGDVKPPTAQQGATATEAAKKSTTGKNLADALDSACYNWDISGCFLWLIYRIWFLIPSGLLYLSAYIFNTLISINLSSGMYDQGFLYSSWSVVRDISNVFFILILIYVGIKTILGMGGHETKSTVASVVMMAILINFSLFFTRVVIDTSNIVALTFYNQIGTKTETVKDQTSIYSSVLGENDVAGVFYKNFNVMTLLDGDFIEQFRAQQVKDPSGHLVTQDSGELPFFATITIILIAGTIMLVTAYVFISSGIFFLGRIIELWIVIIFAPFAFMSYAVPKLSHMEIGWQKWLEKLTANATSAPTFMFFLYVIFLLLKKGDLFSGLIKTSGVIGTILSVIFPAMLIIGLLLKAKQIAKEAGGKFGEMAMSAAKFTAVAATGAVAGGVAVAGRAMIASKAINATKVAGVYEKAKELRKFETGAPNTQRPIIFDNEERGVKILKSQIKISEVEHARHELDELTKGAGVEKEKAFEDYTPIEKAKLNKEYVKKNRADLEKHIRDGKDSSGDDVKVIDNDGQEVQGEVAWANKHRDEIKEQITGGNNAQNRRAAQERGDINEAGELTRQGNDRLRNELRQGFNNLLAGWIKTRGEEKIEHLKHEANEKVTVRERVLAASTSQKTYDVRNLLTTKLADKRDSMPAIGLSAFTIAVAAAVRSGMKGSVSTSAPQGGFLADMKSTISEALKEVKVNVNTGGGGDHGGGHGDSHGGGGGHGGGH